VSDLTTIAGGRVIDPANGVDRVADVVIRDGVIAALAPAGQGERGGQVIEAGGLLVTPGLVDIHVHLRQPGQDHKETIATGTAAAAQGGFTTICTMPNTAPPLDDVATLRWLADAVAREGLVRVHPIACITVDRAGRELVDMAALAGAGAVGFSDDGDTVADDDLMRQALAFTRAHGRAIIVHCEDLALRDGGVMNAGPVAAAAGLPGIVNAVEDVIIERDIRLARETGGRLHVCHVTTTGGVALIAAARREGLAVTGEAMTHHMTMTDDWVIGRRYLYWTDPRPTAPLPAHAAADTNTKVNPPLRSRADVEAVTRALVAGDLSCIGTDHAPHAAFEKGDDYRTAAFGLIGLETALPLALSLVTAGLLDLPTLIARMTVDAARVLKLPAGTLSVGAPADVTLIDPTSRWTVDHDTLASKSHNTPLLGMTLTGRAVRTLVAGRTVFTL
jgi:dihydroorotase